MDEGPGSCANVGGADLISAETFAVRNSGVWRELTPRLESFIRWANTSPVRVAKPTSSEVAVEERAVVAELGYVAFGRLLRGATARPTRAEASAVIARVSPLPGAADTIALSPRIVAEGERIGRCLWHAVRMVDQHGIELRPKFPGCGVVDAAEGDAMAGRCLIEVKSVDRPLRGLDIRQLLVYCALDWAAGRPHQIDAVAVVNPRLGVVYKYGLEALVLDVAGASSSELMDRLQWWFTSDGASR